MNRLRLEWIEAGQVRTQTITDQIPTKNARTFRIGRDPALCDLAIQHPTVSKLHIEIFFVSQQKSFYLRNLRASNPPLVDRQRILQHGVELHQGSRIRLGELDLIVREVQLAAFLAPTVIVLPVVAPPPVSVSSPTPSVAPHPSFPSGSPVPPAQVAQPEVELSYGLQCPKCYRVSPYEHLEVGCAWCGTSLAAAQSALVVPGHS